MPRPWGESDSIVQSHCPNARLTLEVASNRCRPIILHQLCGLSFVPRCHWKLYFLRLELQFRPHNKPGWPSRYFSVVFTTHTHTDMGLLVSCFSSVTNLVVVFCSIKTVDQLFSVGIPREIPTAGPAWLWGLWTRRIWTERLVRPGLMTWHNSSVYNRIHASPLTCSQRCP